MRDVDAATIAALQNPNGIARADLVTVFARDLEGDPVTFGFWSDSGDVSITVFAPHGGEEARNFIGGGALIDAGEVPLTMSLDVRQVPVTFSQLHPAVAMMARGSELRGAGVEIHRALFNLETRLAVGPAHLHFVGEVDRVSIETPPPGGEGAVRLVCVSDTRQLTRVNHARRGLAHSLSRGGDRFLTYAGQVAQWEIWWGEAGARRPGSGSVGGGTSGSPFAPRENLERF